MTLNWMLVLGGVGGIAAAVSLVVLGLSWLEDRRHARKTPAAARPRWAVNPDTHALKTWPEHFSAVLDGRKAFEVRHTNDRTFIVGDVLRLDEWDPRNNRYTGRQVRVRVVYILRGGNFGLPANLCVMGIQPLRDAS